MVHTCCIIGCSNRSNRETDVSFFRIPTVLKNQGEHARNLSGQRREKWLTYINRDGWEPSPYSRVCSSHFIRGKPSYLYDSSNPDWAPTQKMGYDYDSVCLEAPADQQPSKRSKLDDHKVDDLKAVDLAAAATLVDLQEPETYDNNDYDDEIELIPEEVMYVPRDMGVQTDLSSDDISSVEEQMQQLRDDNMYLRSELQSAKSRIKLSCLDENDLKDDHIKLKFYTGFPSWPTFLSLFTLISAALPFCRKLTNFDQAIMFLMKLRLGVFDEDLAYRYGINQSTVSRNFHRVLDIFLIKTESFIHWPSREALHLNVPASFKKTFKNCVAVIDCIEISVEQPSNCVPSNYKHLSTVKFMIGITLQGSVCFISKCWGGHATETEMIQDSDLIDQLMPGDLVLADRKFFVNDYCDIALAEVRVSTLTNREQKQLEMVEVDWSKELTSVRNHVERLMGMVKQRYMILQHKIPLHLLKDSLSPEATVNKLVRVACALVNLSPGRGGGV